MATPGEVLRKLGSLFRKERLDADLDAELASHLELAAEEQRQSGLPPEEARRQALLRLGGVEQSKEEHRDARGLPSLDSVMQDLRYATRTLWRDLGFAIFTILIIGLGVGASSTVFSVLNSILVRPLPFKDPASLVWVANRADNESNMSARTVQVNRLRALRERNQSFTDIAGYFAFYGVGDVKLTGQGEPERLSAVPVSQNFFPLLGVQPVIGRQFSDEECKWNGPKAALLTYGLWERRFGSNPEVVGKAIRLDDTSVTVVGVMPKSFDFGAIFAPGTHIDLFSPFALSDETNRWGNTLALVGRLKPGVPLPRAQAEADILGDQISAEHPRENNLHPQLTLLHEHVSGRLRPALWILACAVGVVMLIVCANLSNLMLARTAARQREMAIRAALGAGRKRLVRQLLTESFLLTGCGAVFGLILTFAATRGVAHLTAFNLPLLTSVRVDPGVLAFTLLVSVATGLLLGVAPALQVSGLRLNSSLGQRGASEGKGHAWLRGALVVSEIAFACVLLVGAGLLIRSFLRVLDVQLGFRPESVASLRIDPNSQYRTKAQKNGYLTEALRLVRNIPGVQAAGLTDSLPLGRNRTWGAGVKGKTYPPNTYPLAFVRLITDGYVKAMGMTLKNGRDFTEYDNAGSTPVMLINETMARDLFPGENPIGQIIPQCGKDTQVIGVVGDVRHMALEKGAGAEMYLNIRQCPDYGSWDLTVRSTLPLSVLSSRVESTLRPIAPDLPNSSMQPLTQLVDRAVSPRRFIVLLLAGFAAFALILASLGIYGLISYSVNRRTQEIGVRMALGASTFDVQSSIVSRTLLLAAAGLLAGVAISSGLARGVRSLLFGVSAGDPLTFVGAALILMMIATLAGYLPARRASKIDPMICLRAD